VSALIERNIREFSDLAVEFRCVDITADMLPAADVALVRQVLQHLSNASISKVAQKLAEYKYVIVTEHLPTGLEFKPNVDKPTGRKTRLSLGSGVVLGLPPFDFRSHRQTVLCAVPQRLDHIDGVVETRLYSR
jgi:hypothetical protein